MSYSKLGAALLTSFLSVGQALAGDLPPGCFTGQISNGSEITIKVTKVSKKKFAINENSDLNFTSGDPYTNFESKISYDVKYSKANDWFDGKQPEVHQSFSVFGNSKVVLRKLSKDKIRYHRAVKYHGPDEKPEPGTKPEKDKGTLVRSETACNELGL